MAAAVGVSLKRGFPATAVGRVGLQVSPGAVVQWEAVPVTEAAWSGEAAERRREPGPGLRGGRLTYALPRSILSERPPAPRHSRRVAAGQRVEKVSGKIEVREGIPRSSDQRPVIGSQLQIQTLGLAQPRV